MALALMARVIAAEIAVSVCLFKRIPLCVVVDAYAAAQTAGSTSPRLQIRCRRWIMSSNAVESGWQRLRGWMKRQWRRSVDPISAGASGAAEVREMRTTEQVQAWEDEGGAPARRAIGGGGAKPASRADPQH
jgi:hypothetical protein